MRMSDVEMRTRDGEMKIHYATFVCCCFPLFTRHSTPSDAPVERSPHQGADKTRHPASPYAPAEEISTRQIISS